MNKLGFHLIDKTNEDFESCLDCVHADDSEETCTLRKCVHAIKYLYDCYEKAERKDATDTNVGKWIPVSERLPEKGNTMYLATVDYGEFGGGVGQRFFYGKNIGWEDDAVIAWMPLPSPYKGE